MIIRKRHPVKILVTKFMQFALFIKRPKLTNYADSGDVEKLYRIKQKVFSIFVQIMVPDKKEFDRIIGNQVEILDSTRCCNSLYSFQA